MFLKACELSERVKSWSPESKILKDHREEKKTRPKVEGHRSTKEELRLQTTEIREAKKVLGQTGTREETESVTLAFSSLCVP